MKKFYALQTQSHLNDLAYVTAVILGDASVYRSHHGQLHYITGKPTRIYTIELQAKDRDFVEHFAQRLDIILHRPEYRRYTLYQMPNKIWRTVVRSSSFGAWWKQLTSEDIESIALRFPTDFLQGIYDSEGNLSKGEVRIFNTNPSIIQLTCKALSQLNLHYHTRTFRKAGTLVPLPNGKVATSKELLVISITPPSQFLNLIHSAIPRKR